MDCALAGNAGRQRGFEMIEAVQHIDDIEIPSIEITEGWPTDSVESQEDCDQAFAYLMSACAQIEYQIDMELTKPKEFQNGPWLAKARCALKYKKTALQIVGHKRGYINDAERRAWQDSRDRRLLEFIRANAPNEQFMGWVVASGVNENPKALAA
jgi:hypothetical protein